MSENIENADVDRHLATALSIGMARKMRVILADNYWPDLKEPIIHHMYQSVFEQSCGILWKLQVAHAVYPEKNIWDLSYQTYQTEWEKNRRMFPPYFQIFSDQLIRDSLSSTWPSAAPLIDTIIEAYLDLNAQYGWNDGDVLPVKRQKAFTLPRHDYQEPLCKFIEARYAARHGNDFVWTDKIAKHMLASHLWDETDLDSANVEPSQVKIQTGLITNCKQEVGGSKIETLRNFSISRRALEIMCCWNGSSWVQAKPKTVYFAFDQAIAISQALGEEHFPRK